MTRTIVRGVDFFRLPAGTVVHTVEGRAYQVMGIGKVLIARELDGTEVRCWNRMGQHWMGGTRSSGGIELQHYQLEWPDLTKTTAQGEINDVSAQGV